MVYFALECHGLMEQPFYSRDTVWQSQYHHLVVGLDLKVVGGNIALTVAGDATNDSIVRHSQLSNRLACDGRTRPDLKLHDVGIDAAEALQGRNLCAKGVFHHIAGSDEFLVDNGVDADVL